MNREELCQNFAKTVEIERINLGLTQEEMAKSLDLSLSGYKKIIRGETSHIDAYLCMKLFNMTGKMFFEQIRMDTPDSMAFLPRLRDLSKSQLSFIGGIIEFEAEFSLLKDKDERDDYVTVLQLTGDMYDGMFYDSVSTTKVNVAKYRARYGDKIHCGIEVSSNHLHPVYYQGDILLICQEPPRNGDNAVFINKKTGRAYLRKYLQTDPVQLIPINGYGSIFTVDRHNDVDMDEWIKFGYVIAKMRG